MSCIKKVDPVTRESIKQKSAYILPDNPTEEGYTTEDIRDTMYKPICDSESSVLAELDRIIDEANEALEGVSKRIEEGAISANASQAAETHTIDLPVSAWVAVEDRYVITAPIEGLKEHDVVIPRVSHAELWNAFDLKVEMADGSITTSVNSIPAEDAVMVIAVLKTLGGEG